MQSVLDDTGGSRRIILDVCLQFPPFLFFLLGKGGLLFSDFMVDPFVCFCHLAFICNRLMQAFRLSVKISWQGRFIQNAPKTLLSVSAPFHHWNYILGTKFLSPLPNHRCNVFF